MAQKDMFFHHKLVCGCTAPAAAEGKYQLKANIPAHIVNTLALFGNRYLLAIVRQEILRQIQMV